MKQEVGGLGAALCYIGNTERKSFRRSESSCPARLFVEAPVKLENHRSQRRLLQTAHPGLSKARFLGPTAAARDTALSGCGQDYREEKNKVEESRLAGHARREPHDNAAALGD